MIARASFSIAVVGALAFAFGWPVHAKLENQRARIAANDIAIERLRLELAAMPSDRALMAEYRRVEVNTAFIDERARAQKNQPVLVDEVLATFSKSGVVVEWFRESGGALVVVGYADDNAKIGEAVRTLQRTTPVTDVMLAPVDDPRDGESVYRFEVSMKMNYYAAVSR